uniref:Homeobox protein HOX1A n=1 Tax=Anthurium amnicola TaxID=1678845 RepID=A0A1D1ZG83_9ARAE
MEENNLGNKSASPKNVEQLEHGLVSHGVESGPAEYKHACSYSEVPQWPAEASSNRGKISPKNSRRLSRYGKKIAMRDRGKRYLLRSSFGGTRVLRSMLKSANGAPPPSNNTLVNHVTAKSKRKRRMQTASNDEFSKIRRSVRYLLHRVSYEQSLIDAYAGEGWKGQSSEKIKPEMELQRAKSEILRCKSKIRNLFQHLDSSISEGKLDDSLFDSEGEISSEDIFCAKCRSKDVYAENDIILCDGICDRGFHQKCLNPPLLNVPPGDEGWLCPGCDCKVDCVELINETHGTDISIEDEWEQIFPEADSFSSKNGQHDDLELPSDDSEDHDFDPDSVEADEELQERSSSDESDFTSTSEDLSHDAQDQNFGFPSDDSEDIDYDPDKPDLDEKAAEDNSSSDESDFTSDTDDLNVPDKDTSDVNEASTSPVSNHLRSFIHSVKGSDAVTTNKASVNSVISSLESEMGQEGVIPVSGKRQRERLDYKKLYDEAYGNKLSDSSDDEEWTDMSAQKNLNYDTTGEAEGLMKNHVETARSQRSSNHVKGKRDLQDQIKHLVYADMNESSNKRKISGKVQRELAVDIENPCSMLPATNEMQALRSSSKFGEAVFQKLQESFRANQYPNRNTKESLARELGMTAQQVSKWFENARHSCRASAKEASPAGPSSVSATSHGKTSKNAISVQEAVGSSRCSEGHQQKMPGESHYAELSKTRNGKNGGAEMKKAVGEAIDRKTLVIRELRKRRKSK